MTQENKGRLPIRLLVLATLMLILLPCAFAAELGESTTILMYMCGSDLTDNCLHNIDEMYSVNLPQGIQIAIQAGGSESWNNAYYTDGSTHRMVMSTDYEYEITDIGAYNMGSPQTLYDFLEWGVSVCPAEHYILVLWNHGGGSGSGVCVDNVFDNDFLTFHEISYALDAFESNNPSAWFDMIGFDACEMATYEMAAHLAPYASYMVASEEVEPGHGWRYDQWIGALVSYPTLTPEQLCITIADSYMNECILNNPYKAYSLSVIDLSKMSTFVPLVEDYAADLNSLIIGGKLSDFSRLRRKMYTFGSYSKSGSEMVDFIDFLDKTSKLTDIDTEPIREAYHDVVRYTVCTDKFEYLTGLSLLWPYQEADSLSEALSNYVCPDDVLPVYSDFVSGLTALLTTGEYTYTAYKPTKIVEQTADTLDMDATVFVPPFVRPNDAPDVRGIFVGGVTPAPDAEEETFESISDPSTEIGAFTATLSELDLENICDVESICRMSVDQDGHSLLVELGSMQRTEVDWDTGVVIGYADKTLARLGDAFVAYYDQVNTETVRRGCIPAKFGEDIGYVIVSRDAAEGLWHIVEFTKGLDENGIPTRDSVQLKPGDVITPLYPALLTNEDGETEETTIGGYDITFEEDLDGMFDFKVIEDDEDDPLKLYYAFRLTDIYGNVYDTEMVDFDD